MLHRRSLSVAALVVGATLVLGCSGDAGEAVETSAEAEDAEEEPEPEAEPEEEPAPEPEPEPEPEEEPEADPEPEEEEVEPEDGGAAAGDMTPAGTTLTIGETAIVEYGTNDGPLLLEFTIDEIAVGSLDDIEEAGFDVSGDLVGQVPHYVRFTAKYIGDDSASFFSVFSAVGLVLEDGRSPGFLSLVGAFEPCETGAFADGGPGEVLEGCRLFVVPEEASAPTARYRDRTGPTNDDPILWGE